MSGSVIGGLHHVEHVMGMAVSIDVRDDIDPVAFDEVVAWLHHVDDVFSTYKDDSEVSRFGRREIPVESLSDELQGVLDLCDAVEIDTDGAFGVHTQAPNGTNFEPSGLVKGWAVQKSALLLEARGAANFTITAGGDLVLRGRPSPNTLWRVGIRHPEQTDQLAAVLHAEGPLAVATSALYERGQHIVDPRTDEPATSLASVTLIGPDLTFVDAYATAVFVMGLEEGLAWLDARHGDYGAFIITQDHLAYSTPVFDRYRFHPESPSCDELR